MYQKTQMTSLEIQSAVGYLPVHESLNLRASLHPDKKLFTFLDDEGQESERFTYRCLWQRAQAVADTLKEITLEGDRVLLFYPQGLDFIAAFFGCLIANRVAVPINLPNKRRVDKCVNIILDTGARVALSPKKTYDKIANFFNDTDASNLNWLISDDIKLTKLSPSLITCNITEKMDDIAFLQYTSGSTSSPKGVMVSHRNIALNLQMMRDSWNLSDSSNMVFWQPHHHDMGLIMGQLLPILLGNHTVIMSPNTAVRQPSIWLHAISNYQAHLSGGPNFIYDLAVTRFSEKRLKGLDLSTWKIAPNGADVVRPSTLERFFNTYKNYGFKLESFMPCYGLAEGTLFVTGGPTEKLPKSMQVDKDILESERNIVRINDPLKGRTLVGCGEPNWETEVAIVDPQNFTECGIGVVGEIWVNSRANAVGYWRKPEISALTFNAQINGREDINFLRTGDIGFIGDDHQLYICGRLKDLIICEGRNLHPEDVEYTILESTDRIKPQSCAVFSYEREGNKQSITAIIEVDRDLKRDLPKESQSLKRLIGQTVTDTHGIGLNEIHFIPPATLKKTTSGKVQRALMKDLYLKGQLSILLQD